MTDKKTKGHVEFNPSPVQVTADRPGDEEMREQLDEMIQQDGFPGSCGVIESEEKQEK
ncbi:hypothetical protein AB6A23_15980 [Paenibacillus tarimensis]